MSKSKDSQSSGSFHQDRFVTPGFASNLARREEPNIDVDAEGGMPIDLVGIPGLHLGDESGMFFGPARDLYKIAK
ncbi:uncharacterized protein N7469_001149 [Penicillium citrinum]|uniref:Uncharacterized protein n=1 Tax=Penicillium citrinum TaxID=5077 RepID=A0A9W9PE31_PENCI|nr:uncharacterized protein N7469_001149 [Penicillium citrinum]KAJ5242822.1 hypothetical protein N7469_001149 [Penicillium citrinum]